MAAVKHLTLKIDLTTDGIAKAKKELDRLNKTMMGTKNQFKEVSKGAGETLRNLRGVRASTGRTNKDFGRMSQGMGGLVAAYATVAANVFALSAAFLVLRRTADLSSMIKSSEDFSNRFGVSVTRITKQLQKATGGALSFAQALPIVNKAVSAGVPIEKMEELAIAATKAAQTFGGTATEALSRFISASQRGRVEIIQTLGVVIKTEQAYKEYGATIGKTALELTAFDRQQAILNATIIASQDVFGGINIDPNPFQQLLTTLTDLKDTFGVILTDTITPFIEGFNKSEAAAAALLAIIVKIVGSKIFPQFAGGISAVATAGQESSRAARAAAANAKFAQQRNEVQKAGGEIASDTSLKAIKKREKAWLKSIKLVAKAESAFNKQIFNEKGQLDKKALTNKKRLLVKEIQLRQAGEQVGRQTALKGTSLKVLKQMLANYNAIALSLKEANTTQKQLALGAQATVSALQRGGLKSAAAFSAFDAKVKGASSTLKTGFAQGFQIAEGKILKSFKAVGIGWQNVVRGIRKGGKQSGTHMKRFSLAVSRTTGLVAGALSKMASVATSAFLIYTIALLVWEKFGHILTGVTKQQTAVAEAAKEMAEGFDIVNKRVAEGSRRLSENVIESLKGLEDTLVFIAGTFESIGNESNQFLKEVTVQLGNLSTTEAIDNIKALKEEIANKEDSITGRIDPDQINKINETRDSIKGLKTEVEALESVFKALADTDLTTLFNSFEGAIKLSKKAGFIDLSGILKESFKDSGFRKTATEIGVSFDEILNLEELFKTGNIAAFKTQADGLIETLKEDNVKGAALLVESLHELTTFTGKEFTGIDRTVSNAIKQLRELNSNIQTYALGLDKLASQKSPYKESFGFVQTLNRQLKDLVEIQNKSPNTKLTEEFTGDQLTGIFALLGLTKDANADIGQLQKLAIKRQAILQEQLEQIQLGTLRLKTIQIEISTIKEREIKTDQTRLIQVRDLNEAQIRATKQKLALARSNRDAAQKEFDTKKASKDFSKVQQIKALLELNTYQRQVNQLEQKQKVQEASLVLEREILKVAKEEFTARNKGVKTLIQMEKIIKSNADNFHEDLISRKITSRLQLDEIKNQQTLLNIEIFRLKTLQEGATARRDIDPLQTEIDLLTLKTAALEEQRKLSEDIRTLQDEGNEFTKEGARLIGEVFNNTIRRGFLELKPTLVTLGEGFANTVTGTFDTAVDNLLEGGHDFAVVVREALKENLRETFGDAIKNAIKGNLAGLLPENKGKIEAKAKADQIAAEAVTAAQEEVARVRELIDANVTLNTSTVDLINKNNELIQAIRDSITNKDTVVSGKALTGPQTGVTEGLVVTSSPSVENAVDLVASTTEDVADIALAATKSSTNAIVDLLGKFLTTGVGENEFLSSVIGFFSPGGTAAHGAIAQGGISAFARGGLVTAPTLGLIGEGKNNEAVVPLPNNREIPVQLSGESGDTIMIEQSFDFRNAGPDTVTQLRSEAAGIEDRTFNRVFAEINKGGKYAKISGRRR